MDSDRPEFIIYAPGFNDATGGYIALHLLCHRLNKLHFKAALWPWGKPSFKYEWRLLRSYFKAALWPWGKPSFKYEWRSLRTLVGYYLKLRWRNYPRGPFRCPLVFHSRYIHEAVVIYPEIVSGNPLGASKVARWFLHKPGYHTGEINYGNGEIYFFYNEAFNDKAINPDADNLLRLTYINPIYKRTNFGPRRGSCYLIRKGNKRILDKHPPDAIPIDNLTHEEKAAVFNEKECLYSYDSHTFYVFYATICGCIPVIIPEEGVSREQWQPSPQRRLGLAYGTSEIALAKQQQNDLLAQLSAAIDQEDQMVCRFVQKCRLHFGL